MPVIGLDRVIANFQQIANSNVVQQQLMDTVSAQTLYLLRNNTPVDSGELRDSWMEITRTSTHLAIGTRQDQMVKLNALLFGTKYQQPNDFLTPILQVIMENVNAVFRAKLRASHPYFRHISGGQHSGMKTPSGIVGLTGTKFVKRRGRGRSYLGRVRTGRKRLSRRLGRRRRV